VAVLLEYLVKEMLVEPPQVCLRFLEAVAVALEQLD
jgi:hypothetical protein